MTDDGDDDDEYLVGSRIHAATVRVIDADGTQLGVLTIEEALRRASAAGLDLVEVNPRATPPVCKIMDFKRFRIAVAGLKPN
jgi:translation initiation factor IF-3